MSNNIPIKLKAALLLTVFALNTVIGFACSAGLNMGFNSKHHHHDDEEQQEHKIEGTHHHDETSAVDHHHNESNGSEKDGCCNDSVIKFQQSDKNFSPNAGIAFDAPVFIIVNNFLTVHILQPANHPVQKLAFPNFHSPPDIRIVIQSFQI